MTNSSAERPPLSPFRHYPGACYTAIWDPSQSPCHYRVLLYNPEDQKYPFTALPNNSELSTELLFALAALQNLLEALRMTSWPRDHSWWQGGRQQGSERFRYWDPDDKKWVHAGDEKEDKPLPDICVDVLQDSLKELTKPVNLAEEFGLLLEGLPRSLGVKARFRLNDFHKRLETRLAPTTSSRKQK